VDDPWLIAGLGNPGAEYAGTRHNAGLMAAEVLCERFGVRLRKVRFLSVLAAEARHAGVPLILTGPATFMNLSGPPIASLAKKRGVPVERVVAIHDEIDLPFGALRIKRGGSTAGHHGLDSLVGAFRSPEFFRVRIGVGRPARRSMNIDYVLKPFTQSERKEMDVLLEDAADAALSVVSDGLAVAQGRYNRPGA
jgi:PTH1 family peptidyl-tRNA hydrolase